MRYCLLCLLLVTGLLRAQDSQLFLDTRQHLIRLDMDLRTAHSDIAIVEKLSEFQELLLTYLAKANPDTFLEELRELDPLIEAIGNRSNLFYHRFRPYKFAQPYSVKDRDGNVVFFTNTYRSNEPLTEQEKSQLYIHELTSYEQYGTQPKHKLTAETFHLIKPGQIYNFVVTSDKQLLFAIEEDDPTIFLTTDKGISVKRIRSPNHTILAGNQPVLSAGTFTIREVDGKRLIFAANDSGHFRPDFESLKEFKKQLVKVGVDPERIICVALEVDFDKLLESVRLKHERRKEEVVILRKTPL
jgi:hypothetical protein